MRDFWTPEKVEILQQRWALGIRVREAAAALGASRGAVIGKARRLGLPRHAASRPHPEVPRKRAKKKPKARQAAQRRRKATPFPSQPGRPPEWRIPFAGLLAHHCRYPVTPEPPFLFCDERRQEKSAYCPRHQALCHVTTHENEAQRRERPLRPLARQRGFSGGIVMSEAFQRSAT